MKTKKSATMESYYDYLQHLGTHYMKILEFNMYNTTRKWNFNSFVTKQKVGANKQNFVNNGHFVNLYKVFDDITTFLNQFTVGYGDFGLAQPNIIKHRSIDFN